MATRARIQTLVEETLKRHETRIVLDAVSVARRLRSLIGLFEGRNIGKMLIRIAN